MASIAPPTATPASTAPTATVAVASINDVATPFESLNHFTICLKVFITTPELFSTSCSTGYIARGQPNRKLLIFKYQRAIDMQESTKLVGVSLEFATKLC